MFVFTSCSGCLNGGGQVKPSTGQNQKELLQKVEDLYKAECPLLPEDDARVAELYQSWLNSVGDERAKELLHTQYHTVEKMTNGLAMKWWYMFFVVQQSVSAEFYFAQILDRLCLQIVQIYNICLLIPLCKTLSSPKSFMAEGYTMKEDQHSQAVSSLAALTKPKTRVGDNGGGYQVSLLNWDFCFRFYVHSH